MNELYAKHALTADGWQTDVAVSIAENGTIAAVRAGAEPAGTEVDILLPAPTNLHSHSFQRAIAGLTEARGSDPQDSFWTWRDLMYRFLAQLTPEDVEAIAAFVQMEMLEAGYAAVAEFHYLHHQADGTLYDNIAELAERIAAGASQSGIGLTLLPVLYEQGGCDGRALGPGQIRCGNTPDRYAKLVDAAELTLGPLGSNAHIGVAPHSLRAASQAGLALATELRPQAPLHIHIAEQLAEVEEVVQAWGQRPVAWLLGHHDIDARWCLVHATHMLPEETRGLAATGAVAGLSPITEANLGDGIFDAGRFLAAGGKFGIGSDSNVRIALAEELRLLEYGQRLRDHQRAVLATASQSTGRVLFEGAASGGAQAAGRNSGVIESGRLADLIALDAGIAGQTGAIGDTLLDVFVFAGGDRMITDTWSAGRHVVRSGRHFARDEITERYRTVMQSLGSRI
jgi:formiminoglutamate deiminase